MHRNKEEIGESITSMQKGWARFARGARKYPLSGFAWVSKRQRSAALIFRFVVPKTRMARKKLEVNMRIYARDTSS